jgi:phage replication O-like protein O
MPNKDRDFDPKQGGFTRLMNEIIDKLASFDLNQNESNLFWAIVRRTWSMQGQAWAEIRWKYFPEKTGISSANVGHIMTRLKLRNIIHTKPGKRNQQYKVNSKVSTWKTFTEIQKLLSKHTAVETTVQTHSGLPSKHTVVPLSKHTVTPIKETVLKKPSKDTPPSPSKKVADNPAPKPEQKKESACSLPAGFNLSLENEKYALMKGIDVERVDDFFDAFLNWAKAKGVECIDWEAQFKTHVDNAPQYGKQYMLKPKKRR